MHFQFSYLIFMIHSLMLKLIHYVTNGVTTVNFNVAQSNERNCLFSIKITLCIILFLLQELNCINLRGCNIILFQCSQAELVES